MPLKKFIKFIDLNSYYLVRISPNFLIYRNSTVKIHRLAQIQVGERFQFNYKWTRKDPFPSLMDIRSKASLKVYGRFLICSGARLYLNEGASLILGSGYINNGLNLSCYSCIRIGNNVAISENVTIRDSDNHSINKSKSVQPIVIEDNVWIGMNVTILKGVTIGSGSVIAAGSVVNKSIPEECLAGGVPCRVIKRGISWEI